jgi:GNAT superfamily N-acetyltransferase
MMLVIEIRPLTNQDDLTAVGELHAISWKQTYQRILPQHFLDRLTHDRWSAVLHADPGSSIGMFEDSTLIGTARLGFPREEGREGYGEIMDIHLLPEKEGQGYGRKLLEASLDALRDQGCEHVCLWVMCANTHAVMFYVHMDFHPTGRIQLENYGGETVELMEMIKPLF